MRSDRYARYPKRRPIVKTTLIIVPLSRELYPLDDALYTDIDLYLSVLETWKAQLKM